MSQHTILSQNTNPPRNIFASWLASLALVVAALLYVGCSNTSADKQNADGNSANGEAKKYRIAVIPKGASHHFWKSVHFGALQAAKELGNVEIDWQSPLVESDTSSQIEKVRNMIVNSVDGIVLAPNHQSALCDVVLEANDAKIPVVIFDSGLAEGPQIVSYVATDNKNGGKLAAQRMAKVLEEKGNVIVLRYRQGSESTHQREEGFLEEIAKYPNIKVLSSDQYGDDTTAKAKEKVGQLLNRFPETNGVFAVCESNANGALEAILEANKGTQIKFVGFDSSERLIEALKNDTCHGIVLQDPVKMGYESVKSIIAHIEKKEVAKSVNTGENVATKENMEEATMKKLLNPDVAE